MPSRPTAAIEAGARGLAERVSRRPFGSCIFFAHLRQPTSAVAAAQYTQLTKRIKRLDRTLETKSGVIQVTDGTKYGHNALNMVNNTFLGTTNGTLDDENNRGQRIGDKVTLVGVQFAMMLELNERYSDVTFRLMVIRSAKGDTPTKATLWDGASGNKMLDTFNTERFTVLY